MRWDSTEVFFGWVGWQNKGFDFFDVILIFLRYSVKILRDFHRSLKTTPLRPRGSIEPSLRTTERWSGIQPVPRGGNYFTRRARFGKTVEAVGGTLIGKQGEDLFFLEIAVHVRM